jgi:hypothetical protein
MAGGSQQQPAYYKYGDKPFWKKRRNSAVLDGSLLELTPNLKLFRLNTFVITSLVTLKIIVVIAEQRSILVRRRYTDKETSDGDLHVCVVSRQ